MDNFITVTLHSDLNKTIINTKNIIQVIDNGVSRVIKLNMVDRVQEIAIVEPIEILNKLIDGANNAQIKVKPLCD